MRIREGRRLQFFLSVVLACALFVAMSAQAAPASPTMHPLVGAYYYLWNPQNFSGGTLREHLVPPQPPTSSQENFQTSAGRRPRTSPTPARPGLHFLAVDWWPYDPGYSGATGGTRPPTGQ